MSTTDSITQVWWQSYFQQTCMMEMKHGHQVQARLRRLATASSDVGATGVDGQRKASPPFPPEFFDRILVDAPCSAMGQRPLLRWGKTQAEVVDHAQYPDW